MESHHHPSPCDGSTCRPNKQCADSKVEDVINYVLSITDRLNRRLRDIEEQMATMERRLQRLEQPPLPPNPFFPSPPFLGYDPYDCREPEDEQSHRVLIG